MNALNEGRRRDDRKFRKDTDLRVQLLALERRCAKEQKRVWRHHRIAARHLLVGSDLRDGLGNLNLGSDLQHKIKIKI